MPVTVIGSAYSDAASDRLPKPSSADVQKSLYPGTRPANNSVRIADSTNGVARAAGGRDGEWAE
jgi:hypothetical protein